MAIKLKQTNAALALGAERVRAIEEVFVGVEEPTVDKGYKIWVDPTGEGVGSLDIDLTDYYTKEEVDNKIEAIPEVDLSDYALKSDIPDTSAFQTEDDVKSLINSALEEVENGAY